jgi:hypothetical protein
MFFYNKKKQGFEFYPKAFDKTNRHHGLEASVRPVRRKLLKAAGLNFIILQVLFLCLFAYIYGALYQQQTRIHNLDIVFVDYDGGLIGTALRNAYNQTLKGKGFPTLIERTPQEYADEQSLRNAVCHIDYWAALFISENSSSNFRDALAGGAAAQNYNRSNIITYIWNEARYGTIVDVAIAENVLVLSDGTRAAMLPEYVTAVGRSNSSLDINIADPNVAAVLANPWQPTSISK